MGTPRQTPHGTPLPPRSVSLCSQFCPAPRGARRGRASAPASSPAPSQAHTHSPRASLPCQRHQAPETVAFASKRMRTWHGGSGRGESKGDQGLCAPSYARLADTQAEDPHLPNWAAARSSSNHSALRGTRGPCGSLSARVPLPAGTRRAVIILLHPLTLYPSPR